jgi:hypothetical protein
LNSEAQQIPKGMEEMIRKYREREAQIKIKSFCKTETDYCFPEGNGIWHFVRVEDYFKDRFNSKYWKPKLISVLYYGKDCVTKTFPAP